MQEGFEGGEQGVGDDAGAFGGGVDAVGLDGAGNMHQVFVDHGDKGGVVFRCEIAEDLLEGLDVVIAVVGREGDAGEQDFDVRVFERGENLVKVAPGLVEGQTAQAVVAAELDDDDLGVEEQDGTEAGDSILGGGAAGALIVHLVVVAASVQIPLQRVGKGLAGLKAVASGDAVTEADQQGPVGGMERASEKQQTEGNDKPAANVHRNSVSV